MCAWCVVRGARPAVCGCMDEEEGKEEKEEDDEKREGDGMWGIDSVQVWDSGRQLRAGMEALDMDRTLFTRASPRFFELLKPCKVSEIGSTARKVQR